jgi:hypothetical protein
MGLFAWRGVFLAKEGASEQLRESVWQSNLFAAKFAARTLESEMASLFKLIEEDARRSDLEERFLACVDEATEDFLRDLARDRAPADSQGRAMLDGFASRIKLEQYLEERLSEIKLHIGSSKKPTRFDSMFVTDRFGTILAGSFTSDRVSNPIGSNVAFRSYFSGQSRDLDEKTPVQNIPRTTSSQVSVPFKSKTTNRNKIAVSTPISFSRTIPSDAGEKSTTESLDNNNDNQAGVTKSSDEGKKASEVKEGEEEQIIEGLLVLTINVGDFELLSDDDEKDAQEGSSGHKTPFAVLVDGHVGANEDSGTGEGTILQHPIFSETPREEGASFRIDAEILDNRVVTHRVAGEGEAHVERGR